MSVNPTLHDTHAERAQTPLSPIWPLIALVLNGLLLTLEVFVLIPRWVGSDEIVMVTLLVGSAFINLVVLVDYYRRGFVGSNRSVRAGDLHPLPAFLRWGVMALNIATLLSLSILFQSRGVNFVSPLELLTTTLFIGAPLVSLMVFLDYNRRGV